MLHRHPGRRVGSRCLRARSPEPPERLCCWPVRQRFPRPLLCAPSRRFCAPRPGAAHVPTTPVQRQAAVMRPSPRALCRFGLTAPPGRALGSPTWRPEDALHTRPSRPLRPTRERVPLCANTALASPSSVHTSPPVHLPLARPPPPAEAGHQQQTDKWPAGGAGPCAWRPWPPSRKTHPFTGGAGRCRRDSASEQHHAGSARRSPPRRRRPSGLCRARGRLRLSQDVAASRSAASPRVFAVCVLLRACGPVFVSSLLTFAFPPLFRPTYESKEQHAPTYATKL